MKMKSTFALLLAAALSPFVPASFAEIVEAPVAKIGTVTVALTLTSEIGGFSGGEDYNSPANTKAKQVYKSVIFPQKYTTADMISDLISRYELSGLPTDYSIKYLDTNQEIEYWNPYYSYEYIPEGDYYDYVGGYDYTTLNGYFLVKNDLSSIRYIGGYEANNTRTLAFDTDNYENNADSYNVDFYSETRTTTNASSATLTKNTTKATYTSTTMARRLFLTPYYDTYECNAVVKSGGSYENVYTDFVADVPDTETSKYSVSATSFTNIVGLNYDRDYEDDAMMTGSFSITALKDTTADLEGYFGAMQNWMENGYSYSD